MTIVPLTPPLTQTKELAQALRADGYVVASAETVAELAHIPLSGLESLSQYWEGLPRDPYLKDGGRYRFRRHASYEMKGDALSLVIIDKLPFAPPDDPVLAARIEVMEKQGKNGFMHHTLPEAIINLKQGIKRRSPIEEVKDKP